MSTEDMSPLDRLIAFDEIKTLKARRDRAIDSKDWVTYGALHAPDHYSENDGFERWTLEETVANTSALLENVDSAHHSHTPEITFTSPTNASGIWAMEDMLYWNQGDEEHWLHGYGHYYETYEKRDGVWLFTSRRLRRTHVHTSAGAQVGSPRVTPRRR